MVIANCPKCKGRFIIPDMFDIIDYISKMTCGHCGYPIGKMINPGMIFSEMGSEVARKAMEEFKVVMR